MTSSITKFRIHLRRASKNAITDLRKNVPKFTNRKLRTIRTLRYEKQAPRGSIVIALFNVHDLDLQYLV